jgi:hypothetical protein
MRAAILLLVGFLLTLAAPAVAQNEGAERTVTGMTANFWLIAYEHPEREWNNVATSFVHGFYSAATVFGGMQCPMATSPRTLAAATADAVKQIKQPEADIALPLSIAARKLGCSVDTDAMRAGAEKLRQKWGLK